MEAIDTDQLPELLLMALAQAEKMPAADKEKQAKLVHWAGSRFRIRMNPAERDRELPPLENVSRAQIRLPELKLGSLALSDARIDLEMSPDPNTGGFQVMIHEARIGTIEHKLATPCHEESSTGSSISGVSFQNVVFNLSPKDGSDLTQGIQLSGRGNISVGDISVNEDVKMTVGKDDRAVSFALETDLSDPVHDTTVTFSAPKIGLAQARVALQNVAQHDEERDYQRACQDKSGTVLPEALGRDAPSMDRLPLLE